MASVPELLDGHVNLEVECLDRLYLNGYIGKLATGPELSIFMRQQLKKPVPSPVVLGQITEKFREAVKRFGAQEQIPLHEFKHDEDKDEIGNDFRRKRGTRDGVVFIGVAQEKMRSFKAHQRPGQGRSFQRHCGVAGDEPTTPRPRSLRRLAAWPPTPARTLGVAVSI